MRNKINEAINQAFKLGQKYEQDKAKGNSAEYSEFYAPTLDRMEKELFALLDVSDMFTAEQMDEAYMEGVMSNPSTFTGLDLDNYR